MKAFQLTYSFIILLLISVFQSYTYAQDNEHTRSHPAYETWVRLQTESQNDAAIPSFPSHGSMSAKELVQYLQYRRTSHVNDVHSMVDHYEMSKAIGAFPEYYSLGTPSWSNTIPRSLPFYKDKLHFIKKQHEDYFFNFNPIVVIGGQTSKSDHSHSTGFNNISVGGQFRFNYKRKVDIDFSLITGTFQGQKYEQDYYSTWNTLPVFLPFQINEHSHYFRYFQPRANLHFNIIKDYIVGSIGYDSHQYGSGIRSLLLSDESAPYLYGKLSTKIWKIKYDNLFGQLVTDKIPGFNHYGGKKFFAAHTLSIQLFDWWQLSLFETVTLSRKQGFEAAYFNPIIFYRATERALGSPDKVAIGMNSDFFPIQNLKVYGQLLINEFTSKYFFSNEGYWANKWGAQLGIYYTNVATISNLDLQLEANFVRPYTYTHSYRTEGMNISNFGNGNTPLAHPLGAGFKEVLLKLKYQPFNQWTVRYNSLFYQAGEDYDDLNLGNNIFLNYRDRPSNFGVNMINGRLKEVWLNHLQISYELWPQLYIDIGGYYRTQFNDYEVPLYQNEWGIYSRIRLNFWKTAIPQY